MSGKLHDVLLENVETEDAKTGMKTILPYTFRVWADAEMLDTIKSVEGVSSAYKIEPTFYSVHTDHRYDVEHIKAEVVSAILCKE